MFIRIGENIVSVPIKNFGKVPKNRTNKNTNVKYFNGSNSNFKAIKKKNSILLPSVTDKLNDKLKRI